MDSRSRFLLARNYALYYGWSSPSILEDLSCFDVAIIEPKGWRDGDICTLKQKGTVVLAYVSALEPEPGEPVPGLNASDLLTVNGTVYREPSSGNMAIDPRSLACRQRLLSKAGQLGRLYDGLFLDTLGDIEQPGVSDFDMAVLAAAHLVRDLRLFLPASVICQNWGLLRLKDFTHRDVDGFCWENYSSDPEMPWTQKLTSWFRSLNRHKVLLLRQSAVEPHADAGRIDSHAVDRRSSDDNMSMARLCADPKFISYLAPQGYASGVNKNWLHFLKRYGQPT